MANNILADTSLNLDIIKQKKGIASDSELARLIGISPQNICRWRNRNTYNVGQLLLTFPALSARWLVLGEGSIYVDPMQQPTEGVQTVSGNGGLHSAESPKQATNQSSPSLAKFHFSHTSH